MKYLPAFIVILAYLILGYLLASAMSGLTHGGLPVSDQIHIALTWPIWILRIFGI